MDKVLFDTHALFENDKNGDPATVKLETNLRASIEKSQTAPDAQQAEVDGIVKDYLNPNDRFATRMKASIGNSTNPSVSGDDANTLIESQPE